MPQSQTSFISQPPEPPATPVHPANYIGANNGKRADNDFYPTPDPATLALLEREQFPNPVWEPACGDGAIGRVFTAAGYRVVGTDLVDRGYGTGGVDLFRQTAPPGGCRSAVTNPPYEVKTARGTFRVEDWVEHIWAMPEIEKMALFMKTTALGGKRRSRVLERSNLSWVLQFRQRVTLHVNGVPNPEGNTGMIDFAWYVFERGYAGPPRIGWIEEVANPAQMPLLR